MKFLWIVVHVCGFSFVGYNYLSEIKNCIQKQKRAILCILTTNKANTIVFAWQHVLLVYRWDRQVHQSVNVLEPLISNTRRICVAVISLNYYSE